MTPTRRELRTFNGLRRVVATLRGPGGCPWDRVQTHESLRPYLLEESYESLDALDKGDAEALCEELGDLLLQILLHVQIAGEHGEFTLVHLIAARALETLKRPTEAAAEYQLYLQESPTGPAAGRARAGLQALQSQLPH